MSERKVMLMHDTDVVPTVKEKIQKGLQVINIYLNPPFEYGTELRIDFSLYCWVGDEHMKAEWNQFNADYAELVVNINTMYPTYGKVDECNYVLTCISEALKSCLPKNLQKTQQDANRLASMFLTEALK